MFKASLFENVVVVMIVVLSISTGLFFFDKIRSFVVQLVVCKGVLRLRVVASENSVSKRFVEIRSMKVAFVVVLCFKSWPLSFS